MGQPFTTFRLRVRSLVKLLKLTERISTFDCDFPRETSCIYPKPLLTFRPLGELWRASLPSLTKKADEVRPPRQSIWPHASLPPINLPFSWIATPKQTQPPPSASKKTLLAARCIIP